MFKDIRGRELHEGDLILTSLSFDGYGYEVLIGSNISIYNRIHGETRKVLVDTPCLLVDSPTPHELEIKNKLLSSYKKSLESKLKSSSVKKSLSTSYSRGSVLHCKDGYHLYLGHVTLRGLDNTYYFSGHCYLSFPFGFNVNKIDTSEKSMSYLNSIFSTNICIYSDGAYFGYNAHNPTNSTLNFQVSKSKKYDSELCSIDISHLDGQIITVKNTGQVYQLVICYERG